MEKILFGIVGWNIAETTRMIEVAKVLRDKYECHFFSYGGQFESLVEEAGFTLHHLEPVEDEEKIEHLWKVDRGETFKQPWTYAELVHRINNEIQLIATLQPKAAFLGSVLTFSISCRLTNTKLFNVIPLALSRPYLKAGLPISPFYPKWLNKLAAGVLLNVPLLLTNFRKVARDFELNKPKSIFEFWEGDINIVAETQKLSLLKKLPDNWYFSGPLFAHLDKEIPPEVEQLLAESNKTKIFFAMGSSANRTVLLKVLRAFENLDVVVIAPIKSHLKEGDHIPGNVYVTDWLPALEVTGKVDIAVIHGGQGTVQTTVSAGVPFVGIGMQPEQELNILLYKNFGNAIQVSKKKINATVMQEAINEIKKNKRYKEKATEAKTILDRVDTTEIIRRIVEENI
ncbi:glycosyltransferase [Alkalibacterium sp. f15]|uniref:glycosyltransferase n=1 Tax=Alkalibacterium sp. f15 TaxID=3414029 RepID=UPI003BF7F90A